MIEKFKKNLPIIAVILGVFSFLMLFCPAIYFESGELEDLENMIIAIRGADIVFGMEMWGEDILKFSFLGLMAFALPVGGCICLYLADTKQDKRYAIAATVCFLAAAICMFSLPSTMVWADKEIGEEIMEEADLSLGVPTIYGAVASLVSALCAFMSKEEYDS